MSKSSETRPLGVALAGFGTVGSGLGRLLVENADIIRRRTGRDVAVRAVLVRDAHKAREVPLPPGAVLTTDPARLVNDPGIDVLVELMGGIDAARGIISAALEHGKHVVTANKALLAEDGLALFRLARRKRRILRYEASVAGAIPVVQALKESLVGNRIESLMGILNGTSNYILSEMTSSGVEFGEALRQAQELGFAEADPTLDIDGHDAAHKLVLLIRLAWGVDYPYAALAVRGIRGMAALDIRFAREFGYRIKLNGRARPATRPCGWRRGSFPLWCTIPSFWRAWAGPTTPCAWTPMPPGRSFSTGAAPAACPRPGPCWPTSWPWPARNGPTIPALRKANWSARPSCRPRTGARPTMCASWWRTRRACSHDTTAPPMSGALGRAADAGLLREPAVYYRVL